MKYLNIFIFLNLVFFLSPLAHSQGFNDISHVFPDLTGTSVQWGDIDDDGYLDFVLSGYDNNSGSAKTIVYINVPGGGLMDGNFPLQGIRNGDICLCDFDNDNDLDLFVTGSDGTQVQSRLYINEVSAGNGFQSYTGAIRGLHFSSCAWADLNNDGFSDLIMSGAKNMKAPYEMETIIYMNENGTLVEKTGHSIPGFMYASIVTADYDKDGDIDFAISGMTTTVPLTSLYENTGNATFILNSTTVFTPLFSESNNSMAWGDFNNDGYPDLILTGNTGTRINPVPGTFLYQNLGSGNFNLLSNTGIADFYDAAVDWGDYDNDGDYDLMIAGKSGMPVAVPTSQIYTNNGNSTFSMQIQAILPGAANGSCQWADYDNDRDLDILYTGNNIGKIYNLSFAPSFNTQPTPSHILSSTVSGTDVVLGWDIGNDQETVPAALSYNLFVGESPQNSNIQSPAANLITGFLKNPMLGSLGFNTSWSLKNLQAGKYYWAVQCIDASYQGSTFTDVDSFEILPPDIKIVAVNHTNPYCGNTAIRVFYKVSHLFNPGNEFQVVFDGAVIGTSASSTDGKIECTIPSGLNPGVYEIVVHSTSPVTQSHVDYFPLKDTLQSITYTISNPTSSNNSGNLLEINVDPSQARVGIYRLEQTPAWITHDLGSEAKDVAFDNSGNVWVATTNTGLAKYDGNTWIYFNNLNSNIPSMDLEKIAVRGTEVWLIASGTKKCLMLMDGGTFVEYKSTNTCLPFDDFQDIELDNNGNVWLLGNQKDDIIKFNPVSNNCYRFNSTNSILPSMNRLTDIKILSQPYPKNKYIWVTAMDSSIYKFDLEDTLSWKHSNSNIFKDLPKFDGLNGFHMLSENPSGNIYSGGTMLGNALFRYDGYHMTTNLGNHFPLTGINNPVNVAITIGDIQWWFEDGLLYNNMGYTNIGDKQVFKYDSMNRLWVAFPGGIAEFGFPGKRVSGNNFSGLSAGKYLVEVNHPALCTFRDTIIIDSVKLSLTYTVTDALCYGDSSGSIELSVTGGPAPYTYAWSTGDTSKNLYNLPSGFYTVSVSDSDANIIESDPIFVDEPTFIQSQLVASNSSGSADGSVDLTVMGGTAPYTFVWTHPMWGSNRTTEDIYGLFPGWYYVTVTDKNNCQKTDSVEVMIAPPFVRTNTVLSALSNGKLIWGDFNNDEFLDLFVFGEDDLGDPQSIIYKYEAGNYVDIVAGISGISEGDAAWGDFDNDGDLDLLITGNSRSIIYRNDNGTFTNIAAGLPALSISSCAWGDYNNDGFLDFVLCGSDIFSNPKTYLYRNNRNGTFSLLNAGLNNVSNGFVAWSDYDNDGDMDLLISGEQGSFVYQNTNGAFTNINAGLSNFPMSRGAWFDYDSDGDFDIILMGMGNGRVYRNDNGSFTQEISNLPFLTTGSLVSGDFDNDGFPDILVSGKIAGFDSSTVFINKQNSFDPINAGLEPLSFSHAAWADIDSDGDLDLALMGLDKNAIPFLDIYQNERNFMNTAPDAPDNLQAQVVNNNVVLSWNSSTDDKTPSQSLTYNIFAGDDPANVKNHTPMSHTNTGKRKIIHYGNTCMDSTWTLKNLALGAKLHWGVQAIDHTFLGSVFRTDSFEVPLLASFNMALNACADDTVTITFTGNADSTAIYTWNFDGANVISGSGQGPYKVFWSFEGNKTVSLFVKQGIYTSDTSKNSILIAKPVMPVASDRQVCEGDPVPPLTATGSDLKWYSDIGLSNLVYSGNSYNTGISVPGIYQFYVTQSDIGSCESDPDTATLIIYPLPPAPFAPDRNAFSGGPVPDLTATGSNIVWYDDPSLSNVVHTGNTFSTGHTAVGIYTYYVTQSTGIGCQSPSDSVTLTISSSPLPPYAPDQQGCFNSPVPPLVAFGSDIKWYSDTIAPTLVHSGDTFHTGESVVGTYTYFVTQSSSTQESHYGIVRLIIHPLPGASITGSSSICERDTASFNILFSGTSPWSFTCTNTTDTFVVHNNSHNPYEVKVSPMLTSTYRVIEVIDSNLCSNSGTGTHSVTVVPSPAPPISSDIDACEGSIIPDLFALGLNIKWYSDSLLTNFLHSGITYTTGQTQNGEYVYYATQSSGIGCESLPLKVTLRIYPDIPPVVADEYACEGGTIPVLSATGNDIKWYSDAALTNLIYSGNTFNTGQSLSGTYTYYVTQTLAGVCESSPLTATLHIFPVLPAPVVQDKSICENDFVEFIANGNHVKWYSDNQLQNLIHTGDTLNTLPVNPGTYYFFYTDSLNGCISDYDSVELEIKPRPAPPVAIDTFACFGSPVPDLNASGLNVKWFDDRNCNNLVNIGNTFNTGESVIGDYTYYLTDSFQGCKSIVDSVVLSISPIPPKPTAADLYGCEGKVMPPLTSSGMNPKWYGDSLLTNFLHQGSSFSTGQTNVGTYTYYVTQSNQYCESEALAVKLVIQATPPPPFAADTDICEGQSVPDLTATGSNIKWYDDRNLNNQVASGNVFITGKTNPGIYKYYLTQTASNSCESNPDSVILRIYPIPSKPHVQDIELCEGNIIPAFTASGYNIQWFDSPLLNNPIHTGDTFQSNQTSSGVYTYYVYDSLNTCLSTVDTARLIIHKGIYLNKSISSVACYGENTGEIDLNLSGGTAPVLIFWSNGDTAEHIKNLAAGTFIVYVIDANNCEIWDTTAIIQPNALTINHSKTDLLCYGDANGAINLSINGGIQPYKFLWNTGDTTQNISNLNKGLYLVTVQDMNNCISLDSIEISEPDSLEIAATVTDVGCTGWNNGSINITVNGGIQPYSYTWSNGETTKDISNLNAGSYSLTLKDSNNCSRIENYEVKTVESNILENDTILCLGDSITLHVKDPNPLYSYMWSSGDSGDSSIVSPQTKSDYILEVTYNSSTCRDTINVDVHIIKLTMPDTLMFCHIDSFVLDGGSGYHSYLWNTGEQGQHITVWNTGNYTLTVQDPAACEASATSYVNMINARILQNDTILKQGSNIRLNVLSHVPNYSMYFDGNSDFIDIKNDEIHNFGYNQDFTLEVWFKTDAFFNKMVGLLTKGNDFASIYQLGIFHEQLNGELGNPYAFRFDEFITTKHINDGGWHHAAMVVTRTSNMARLYLDGEAVIEISDPDISYDFLNSEDNLRIGVDRTWGAYYQGHIDEVRIWNKALSTFEIRNRMFKPLYPHMSENLIAYYDFNEGYDTIAFDMSNRSNHGRIYGAASSNDVPFMPTNASKYNFLWSTGDTSRSVVVSPFNDTMYVLRISDAYNTCYDSVFIRIDTSTTMIEEPIFVHRNTLYMEIYPNPNSNGVFNIRMLNVGEKNVMIHVYDNLGSLVYSRKEACKDHLIKTLRLEDAKKGMYFVRLIIEPDTWITEKLIIH